MNDDLKDIDPALVEAILDNADTFADFDEKVNAIVQTALQKLEHAKTTTENDENGTVESFTEAAEKIKGEMKAELQALEDSLKAQAE